MSPNTEHSHSTVKVLYTTLDDIARERVAPYTIKTDVEGVESGGLKGTEKLSMHSRQHLVCEVHDPANSSFVEAWLKTRGYELRWLDTNDSFPRQLLAVPK